MPNMELVLALLGAATLLAAVARHIHIPYPIVLVIAGSVLAAIPGVPTVKIPPNVVFLVFLPPLLYSAAVVSSPAELRANATPILVLAIGLVLATVAVVAAIAHAVTRLPWSESFVLGAILGATDPLAATSVIGRLGAPQRIASILEGEALVNDGTSLTVFKVGLAAVGAGGFSLTHGIARFAIISAGGIAIGVAVGGLSAALRHRLDDPNLEVAIGLLTAYSAYIAADEAGTSGVLATVAAGLLTSHLSTRIFSAGTRLRSHGFFEVSSFILNALLSLLIGLQLRAVLEGIKHENAGILAWQAAGVVGGLMLLRMGWMFTVPSLVGVVRKRLQGTEVSGSWRPELVLGWSGMRGALSLAAALSVPFSGPHSFSGDRGLVLYLAFAGIFVTMVVPGLTLGPLIRVLGLGQSEQRRHQEAEARLRVALAALEELDRMAEEDEISQRSLARLRDLYQTRAAALEQRLGDEERTDRLDELEHERTARARLVDAQRRALARLERERHAPLEILREIEHDLDLEGARLPRV